MDRHRDLPAWKLGRALVKEIFVLTRRLPPEERFVTVAQLRRAAWSVPNNIAEGNAKFGPRELRKYLDIAIGSLAEIDSMVTILPDVQKVDPVILRRVGDARCEAARSIYRLLRNPGR